MNDLEQRVAKLRAQGPDYGQWSWENEDREKPDDGRGWVERELTGNQRITCACGFGTDWIPRADATQQARAHIHGEHPEWAGTPAWID